MPVIPFADADTNTGMPDPIQIDLKVPKLKDGFTIGFTVIVKVKDNAHCPAAGVNIYVPLV